MEGGGRDHPDPLPLKVGPPPGRVHQAPVPNGDGHGVDGKVPLPQIGVNAPAQQGLDIDGEVRGDHPEQGMVNRPQADRPAPCLFGQLGGIPVRFGLDRYVVIRRLTAQKGVPDTAAHQIGPRPARKRNCIRD